MFYKILRIYQEPFYLNFVQLWLWLLTIILYISPVLFVSLPTKRFIWGNGFPEEFSTAVYSIRPKANNLFVGWEEHIISVTKIEEPPPLSEMSICQRSALTNKRLILAPPPPPPQKDPLKFWKKSLTRCLLHPIVFQSYKHTNTCTLQIIDSISWLRENMSMSMKLFSPTNLSIF